jgi:hypothetical protein
MIPNTIYLIRDVFFGLSMGVSSYVILLFSKPIIDNISKKTYSADGYYWFVVFFSVIIGLISWIIL